MKVKYSINEEKFIDDVWGYLKRTNMTFRNLSILSGVDAAVISKNLNHKLAVSIGTLQKICKVMNVKPDDYLSNGRMATDGYGYVNIEDASIEELSYWIDKLTTIRSEKIHNELEMISQKEKFYKSLLEIES